MLAISACTHSSAKKATLNNNVNTPQQEVSTQAKASVPDIDLLRLDTKLNIQFDWWKLLQSPRLNMLIEQVFNANPTVEGAQKVLLKLQQNDISRAGFFYSSINVNDGANGQGRLFIEQDIPVSDEAKFVGESYYDIRVWQLAVGYVPDMLRTHSLPAATKAEIEVQNLQMEGTYRTLAGNLIACVIQDASLRAQMSAARKVVAIEQNWLSIIRKKMKAGQATPIEENSREQDAEFATRALQRLKDQFDQIRSVEKLLLNVADVDNLPEGVDLALLKLSVKLPLELPAAVIEQRPDVRAAQLEMLPANTKYQTTADTALKNVESTLFAIHNDAISLKAAEVSEQENLEILEQSRRQYKANMLSYEKVLTAELEHQLATIRALQARAKQLGNAVLLYHALGGNWWGIDEAVRLEIDGELSPKNPDH